MDLQRLLDLEDVRSLQAKYCIWVDQKRWSDLRTIFADDAILEMSNKDERPSSPAGIVDYIAGAVGDSISSHHCTASIVTFVDIDHAEVTWSMLYVSDGSATTSYGFYENEVARIAGAWKVTRMRRIRRLEHP
jgi:SnoaL-like domain